LPKISNQGVDALAWRFAAIHAGKDLCYKSYGKGDTTLISSHRMMLTIVVPALNEEEAIGRTIQDCLDALPEICERGQVEAVEIVVVSDGSTDRTAPIAQEFADLHPEVRLMVFEENRGYGAAIKEGFRIGSGELVAFLDADGTCDPRFFGDLCAAIQNDGADIAVGDRMGPGSDMPRVRRLGNRLFALLLGFLSGEAVTDTASGMRVLRRDSLPSLLPLPDRMDFTPAMSARAIMQGMRVVEVPMRYSRRVGASKLQTFRDGFRFLRVILDAVLFYSPARLFMLGFLTCTFLLLLLALSPTEFYLHNGYVEEWMIYRFVACLLLGNAGFTLLCSAIIADNLFFLTNRRRPSKSFGMHILRLTVSPQLLLLLGLVCSMTSVVLVWPGVIEYFRTQHVTLHWSRVIVSTCGFLLTVQCLVTACLLRIVSLWRRQLVMRHDDSATLESSVRPHRFTSRGAGVIGGSAVSGFSKDLPLVQGGRIGMDAER
jgi:glycosyltransferase involved in cell wall biosynthesis